jgi:DNA-damage-inducible protein J|nr:MAG TPA: addiction module antitoxin [Bacteriophage sp.]DAU73692.1 MAG TPA: addiction module antitoxin [Bacteriophage sp.]
MTPVSTNIKIDPELKEQSQALFESFGLTLSAAVNMFLRQAVREQAIPFRVGDPLPNAETIEAIQEVKRMKANSGLGKTYSNVDQMMEELLADV